MQPELDCNCHAEPMLLPVLFGAPLWEVKGSADGEDGTGVRPEQSRCSS